MTQKKPEQDTTIADIHRERQRMAEIFGGDIATILEDARKRQEASGRAVWQGPAPDKVPAPTGPAPAICDDVPAQQVGPV